MRRFGAGFLRFVLYGASFFVAGTLGWGLALVLAKGFGRFADSFRFQLATGYWFLCAVPLAVAFMIVTRRRLARGRILLLTASGWAAFALVATTVLLSIPGRPEHRFLDNDTWLLSANPGGAGLLWDVYTFPGTVREVSGRAIAELAPGHFEARNRKDGSVELISKRRHESLLPVEEITISSGRTTGTYWWVDGDFLEIDRDPNWVTVSVARIDPLPMWLRLLVE